VLYATRLRCTESMLCATGGIGQVHSTSSSARQLAF